MDYGYIVGIKHREAKEEIRWSGLELPPEANEIAKPP